MQCPLCPLSLLVLNLCSGCPWTQVATLTTPPSLKIYHLNSQIPIYTVLLGVRTISDIIRGKCAPKTRPKGASIGIIKPNCQNLTCNASENMHLISLKFDDETHTINDTSRVVHQSRTWHTTWLTSAILKIHNVIARPPTARFTRNLVCWCKIT